MSIIHLSTQKGIKSNVCNLFTPLSPQELAINILIHPTPKSDTPRQSSVHSESTEARATQKAFFHSHPPLSLEEQKATVRNSLT